MLSALTFVRSQLFHCQLCIMVSFWMQTIRVITLQFLKREALLLVFLVLFFRAIRSPFTSQAIIRSWGDGFVLLDTQVHLLGLPLIPGV